MTATDVLARLRALGISVAADGDDLVLRPSSKLTPEMLALVRAHKPALLALLMPTGWSTAYPGLIPPGVCLDCGGSAPRDGMHWCAPCRARSEAGR